MYKSHTDEEIDAIVSNLLKKSPPSRKIIYLKF